MSDSFYAGHGLQVDGRNFLAPVDAALKSDTDLDFEAIELNLVLKQLERNARLSIVFLDACRDNPLARNLVVAGRSLAVGRGLAQVEKAVGMMIALALEPPAPPMPSVGGNVLALTWVWHSRQACPSSPLIRRKVPLPWRVGRPPGEIVSFRFIGPSP